MQSRLMPLRVIVLAWGILCIPPPLAAQAITPDPSVLRFGRVDYDGDRCMTLLLTNSAPDPVDLLSVSHPAEPFPTEHEDSLFPGETTGVEICFAGRRLGPDTSVIRIVYTIGGGRDTVLVPALAFGWDSLAVGIGVTVTGKPGSVLRVPLRVFGSIPASHDIRSFVCTLQYNKTLLYPLSNFVASEGSLVSGMADVRVDVERDNSTNPASAIFRIRALSPLVNPRTDSVLFRPAFLVLQGNAMSSDLTLSRINFADGLPRGGAFLKGRFLADSICYQRLRLVEFPAVRSTAEIGSFPNPAQSSTMIRCFLPSATTARVALHGMLGQEVRCLHEGPLAAGDHAFAIDVSVLPPGSYLCRLSTAAGEIASSILVRP
ncbi:MAG: T9SS type A sorting domain-containing protein [Bacteroidota bacterium]|nr:T9SS type A sorting domain-containing protein [Bacteroidota bacterium]